MANIEFAIKVHASLLAFLSFVLWYEVSYIVTDGEGFLDWDGFGGKFKYLTTLSLVCYHTQICKGFLEHSRQ